MKVSYKGITGIMLKLERNLLVAPTSDYELSIYDDENRITYTFAQVYVEDIKFIKDETSFKPVFNRKPMEAINGPLDALLSFGRPLEVFRANLLLADKPFRVNFRDCRIKDGENVICAEGKGETLLEACKDYLGKIEGKDLIFNCFGVREEQRSPYFFTW